MTVEEAGILVVLLALLALISEWLAEPARTVVIIGVFLLMIGLLLRWHCINR